jgi:phosphorylase kinase alpha/beta subunit
MTRSSPVLSLIKEFYLPEDLARISALLQAQKTLIIEPDSNGLFPSSSASGAKSSTGYQDVWIRDNVMVASSFLLRGETNISTATMQGLTRLLESQEERFKAIITEPAKRQDVQLRPHVRFNFRGASENWSHAQNDALGYALWLRFLLANRGHLPIEQKELPLYCLFPRYFAAIQYWTDADSGAWEEDRKVNCSSIGAVVAGLRQMAGWLRNNAAWSSCSEDLPDLVLNLIRQGEDHLRRFLPYESPPKRLADAAVLFLIHPAEVASPEQQESVLQIVQSDLERNRGIIRYTLDSYYGQDYPDWFDQRQLTADFSEQIDVRNAKLRPGYEAQWCIFDPLLSVIYGKKFLASPGEKHHLEQQTHYFNRSLRQLTGEMQCPELYFFRHENWVPNPHTPLAWTQANLALALNLMKKSVAVTTAAAEVAKRTTPTG